MPENVMIEVQNATRVYTMGARTLYALRDVSMQVERGEFVAVVGPSGSAADPVPQMQHAVAPDHDVGVLQQVLGVDRAEVPLAGTKHDGHDIHRHLIHEAQGKGLSTDVTGRASGLPWPERKRWEKRLPSPAKIKKPQRTAAMAYNGWLRN